MQGRNVWHRASNANIPTEIHTLGDQRYNQGDIVGKEPPRL